MERHGEGVYGIGGGYSGKGDIMEKKDIMKFVRWFGEFI
jgi:hypothetical protein